MYNKRNSEKMINPKDFLFIKRKLFLFSKGPSLDVRNLDTIERKILNGNV